MDRWPAPLVPRKLVGFAVLFPQQLISHPSISRMLSKMGSLAQAQGRDGDKKRAWAVAVPPRKCHVLLYQEVLPVGALPWQVLT